LISTKYVFGTIKIIKILLTVLISILGYISGLYIGCGCGLIRHYSKYPLANVSNDIPAGALSAKSPAIVAFLPRSPNAVDIAAPILLMPPVKVDALLNASAVFS
jgi:hypothetical protein